MVCRTCAKVVLPLAISRAAASGAAADFAESFAMELSIATRCAQLPDFPDGVRALLIDKDGQPVWQYKQLTEVPDAHVRSHFSTP